MSTATTYADLLEDLARHQAWADAAHWKTLRENATLLEDAEIRKRLNHMLHATSALTVLAQGGSADPAAMKDVESADQLEAAQTRANADVVEAIRKLDLQKILSLPRGPRGPWEASAGMLLMQAVTHSQHHRGQNASRMRQLGVAPPMTDYLIWYALGRP